MNYKINPLSFSGIFPVPNVLVDENIRLASVVQLKTVLYLLRHGNEKSVTAQQIADALMLDKEDVADAMVFWMERGIVLKDGDTTVVSPVVAAQAVSTVKIEKAEAQAVPAVDVKEKKVIPVLDIPRPSHEQVALRVQECQELSTLFQEAQAILGKTIGYEGQAVLIMMYDGYGLPIEVILMAVQYAVDQKKTGYSQIAKIGKIWCENEVNTLEAVDEYLAEHTVVDEAWEKLRSLTGITNRHPTEKQRKHITVWVKEYGYSADMIFYAYEECIDNTGKMSMPYMDKIISGWHKAGVKTPADIAAVRTEWKNKSQKNGAKKSEGASKAEKEVSYDIDKYMKTAINLRSIKIEND